MLLWESSQHDAEPPRIGMSGRYDFAHHPIVCTSYTGGLGILRGTVLTHLADGKLRPVRLMHNNLRGSANSPPPSAVSLVPLLGYDDRPLLSPALLMLLLCVVTTTVQRVALLAPASQPGLHGGAGFDADCGE